MPDTHPPLEGSQRLFATLLLAASNFMVILDTTIANVSLPHIAGSLAVSPNQGTWIITSYAIAEAVVVPLTGWLTDRTGIVRLFVACILGFTLSSLLCAWSVSLGMIVTARVLQGLCGGMIMPLSQALLYTSYPREKAGKAMGIWAMTALLGPITGPVLGGWISDNLAWQWIFYINLPIGLAGAVFVWKLFHARETRRVRRPIDYVGLALLVAWVGGLQLMLDKGRELDWFESPLITGLAVVVAISFVAFLIWERYEEHPIVDLRVFRDRNFSAAVVAASVIFSLFFGYVILMPLWMQTYHGYTALWAGLAMAPTSVLAVLIAPIVGLTANRVDARIYATFSVCVFACVFLWRSTLTPDASFAAVATPQLFIGLGTVTLFLPLTNLALADIRPAQLAAAAGLQNFVRTLFAAFTVAMATTYWSDGIVRHHATLVENVTPYGAAAQSTLAVLGAAGSATETSLALIDMEIARQAAVIALADYCRLAAVLVIIMAPLIWLAHRPKGAVDVSALH